MDLNLVLKNQNSRIIDTIQINIIKSIQGELTKEKVLEDTINLTYNKVIIDITAIRNFYDISSTLKFLSIFDPNKVILLLNDSDLINGSSYLSALIEKGFYNFTRNAAGINYLLNHPNTLNDVISYTKPNTNNNNNNNYEYAYETSAIQQNELKKKTGQKIIGIQNLSEHAGATTLMYMMEKQLNYNYSCKAIEMNKQDSIYFRDNNIVMCTGLDDLKLKIKAYFDEDVILIDLNGLEAKDLCDEMLYLIEPGVIGINKLVKRDSNIFEKIKYGKVVLNRSSIKDEELSNFEYETKFKIFYNLPNFNERKERLKSIDLLLIKLGFDKQNMARRGLFG